MTHDPTRRGWMALAGPALISLAAAPRLVWAAGNGPDKDDEAKEVPAVEDLMREHGILRRALLVYSEAATRLSQGKGDVPIDQLGRTAALFRSFGEDYHERALEEKHVFPPLIEAGGTNASLAKTLSNQHDRGRDITEHISAVARRGRIQSADATTFAGTLASFVRMYEHHAAIEDTVIFPAWKKAISGSQYRELTEQFEDLEHKMFGKDGFEDALEKIASIEQSFGLADLSALTPPAPPSNAAR